ncbi:hypothetical protein FRB91_003973 [Serendipita sp. 411]|nr:hypothetical protein FRB91_003973 [Serendipita sp. 411]
MDIWHEAEQAFHSVPIPTPAKAEDDIPPAFGLHSSGPSLCPNWSRMAMLIHGWLRCLSLVRDLSGVGASKRWEGKVRIVDPDSALTLQSTLEKMGD